jgi:hypothetical protein
MGMPPQLLLLRIVVALMCIVFAYLLGRALARPPRPGKRGAGPTGWALRTLVAGAALTWRGGLDLLAGVAFGLAAVAAVGGALLERRRPKEDDKIALDIS